VTRVLYLITDLDVGGAERVLLEVVRRLDRERYRPAVCSLAPPGDLAREFDRLGVPVFGLGMTGYRHLLRAGRLFALLRRHRFDILHTHLCHANVLGRVVGRLAGVPVVVSTTHVAEPRRWHLLLERGTASLVDRVVAVSEAVGRYMIEQARIPAEKVLVIRNGVDPSRFRVPRGEFRQREGIPADRLLVTSVGRLHEQKGLGWLLEAARLVVSEWPEVRFLVVGEGPERKELLRLRDRAGLEEYVRFLGFRPDVPQILADSDVFVLPSLWEGLAIALLEAMAAGLPVVVTDVEGVREVVTDGETGLVVPPADAGALSSALGRLLSDPGLRKRLARAGRERVIRHFGWGKVVSDTMALYDTLLSECRPKGP